MDKRNLIKYGSASVIASICSIATTTGYVKEPVDNWLEEMLLTSYHVPEITLFSTYTGEDKTSYASIRKRILEKLGHEITHAVFGADMTDVVVKDRVKFSTIKEAYDYAKQLKERHYG